MKLTVYRFLHTENETIGILFINGIFECYTLEDEFRTTKVWGETRIPEGTYQVKLRKEGGHHNRYSQKFPDIHKGMLHVQDVPNFKWILIHIGNDDDDTAGCLLVGEAISSDNKSIARSTLAYKKMYKKVADALEAGEDVYIQYRILGAD